MNIWRKRSLSLRFLSSSTRAIAGNSAAHQTGRACVCSNSPLNAGKPQGLSHIIADYTALHPGYACWALVRGRFDLAQHLRNLDRLTNPVNLIIASCLYASLPLIHA